MDSKTQNKRIFYRALQGIDLFVPCAAESDEALTIEVVRNDSGEVFVPAFFTKKSAKEHFADKTLAEFTFPQLREIVTKLPKHIRGIVIEPFEKETTVRMRIDGVLHEILTVPKQLQSSVISRIKIMVDMDISERRIPQDGRANVKVRGKDYA